MENTYNGSCLCEQITFEIQGNFESFYLCHCKHCQKDTGSAHAANLFSTTAKLKWIAGGDKIKTYVLTNTRHTKSFCTECGSAMPSLQMEGKLLVVPAGSLNSEIETPLSAHIFYSSKASWDQELKDIQKFEKYPE